jgi:hypothetical protein
MAFFHEPSKIRVQLRSAAGDIDSCSFRAVSQELQDALGDWSFHAFGSFRSRIHMTVLARLIANLSYVDLNG